MNFKRGGIMSYDAGSTQSDNSTDDLYTAVFSDLEQQIEELIADTPSQTEFSTDISEEEMGYIWEPIPKHRILFKENGAPVQFFKTDEENLILESIHLPEDCEDALQDVIEKSEHIDMFRQKFDALTAILKSQDQGAIRKQRENPTLIFTELTASLCISCNNDAAQPTFCITSFDDLAGFIDNQDCSGSLSEEARKFQACCRNASIAASSKPIDINYRVLNFLKLYIETLDELSSNGSSKHCHNNMFLQFERHINRKIRNSPSGADYATDQSKTQSGFIWKPTRNHSVLFKKTGELAFFYTTNWKGQVIDSIKLSRGYEGNLDLILVKYPYLTPLKQRFHVLNAILTRQDDQSVHRLLESDPCMTYGELKVPLFIACGIEKRSSTLCLMTEDDLTTYLECAGQAPNLKEEYEYLQTFSPWSDDLYGEDILKVDYRLFNFINEYAGHLNEKILFKDWGYHEDNHRHGRKKGPVVPASKSPVSVTATSVLTRPPLSPVSFSDCIGAANTDHLEAQPSISAVAVDHRYGCPVMPLPTSSSSMPFDFEAAAELDRLDALQSNHELTDNGSNFRT